MLTQMESKNLLKFNKHMKYFLINSLKNITIKIIIAAKILIKTLNKMVHKNIAISLKAIKLMAAISTIHTELMLVKILTIIFILITNLRMKEKTHKIKNKKKNNMKMIGKKKKIKAALIRIKNMQKIEPFGSNAKDKINKKNIMKDKLLNKGK